MRWAQGRAEIEQMIAAGEIQRVPASRELADTLLAQASTHLTTAGRIKQDDPQAGYVILYDAARKSLAAILENQGLRATSRGGHVAVSRGVTVQLDPPLGVDAPCSLFRA